jgi:hypothetical protein
MKRMPLFPTTPPGAVLLLRKAADLARDARSADAAVCVAWDALHTEGTDHMQAAFEAWARAEDYDGSLNALGTVIRRRHRTPAAVADSLDRAAGPWIGATAMTDYDRGVLVQVLVYHQPTNTSGCICGWSVLGASHPEHVADVYELARTGSASGTPVILEPLTVDYWRLTRALGGVLDHDSPEFWRVAEAGREANQGEIGIVIDGTYFGIVDYEEGGSA